MNKFFLLIFAGLLTNMIYAQSDTIIVSNGNLLIGEIKSLSRKVITFDSDYADSEFKIDWDKVTGISTTTKVIVYTSDNQKLIGHLNFSKNDTGQVIIITEDGDVKSMKLEEIVSIETLDNSFSDRISLSIAAGFSYTKANNVTQFTTSSSAKYTGEKWKASISFNGLIASQDSVETSTRNEGDISISRDFVGKIYSFAGLELLKSTEQSINLRATGKLGFGMYFIRKNGFLFNGGIGLANTNEKYDAPNSNSENTFEGLVALKADAYDIGDFSISMGSTMYPSLSESGRIRVNSNISLKWDLPLDFYIKASFVHNYDSKPLSSGADKQDYVLQTSIGWDWN